MSGRHIDIDVSELQNFFARAERAAKGDFRKELEFAPHILLVPTQLFGFFFFLH